MLVKPAWHAVAVVALATLASARVFEPTLLFSFGLGDMTSMVTFVPDFKLPPEKEAWNTTFSESPLSTYVEGMAGKGTALRNAYMVDNFRTTPIVCRLPFVGRGLDIRGSVTGQFTPPELEPWVISVNGQALPLTPPVNNVLVQNSSLPFGYQRAWFALEYGSWSIGAVTIMTGMVAEVQSIDDVPTCVEPIALKGKINPFFTKKGEWKVSDHIGGVGGQAKIPYRHAVGSTETNAELSVTLPPKVSFIVINGTTGPAYDKLYINLSPAPPLNPVSFTWASTRNRWVSDSIVYAMPLDPRVVYNLSMAPALNSSVALHSITMYSGVGIGKNNATAFNGRRCTRSDNSTNKGAIAGGVVGGVFGLALLLAGAFWAWRTYRRNRNRPLRFDRADDATATPFIAPAGAYPPRPSQRDEKMALYDSTDSSGYDVRGEVDGSLRVGETPSGSSSFGGSSRTPVATATSEPIVTQSSLSEYKTRIIARTGGRQPSSNPSSEMNITSGLPPGAAPR